MTPTIEIDASSMRQLNVFIQRFVAETGRDAAKVLKDQAKLFVRDLARATPPFGRAAFSETFNAQRRVGEAAVERDIRRVFVPLRVLAEDISKENPKLGLALLMAGGIAASNITTKKSRVKKSAVDMDALDAIFRNMGMEGRVIRYADPALHEKARGRKGRVRRATPYFVVSEKSIDNYIKTKQAHVGKSKAGWVKAAVGLGVALPNWIRRHLTPGVYRDRTGSNNPDASITLGNLVEFSADFSPRPFEAAIVNRQRGMLKQLEKMAEHAARKANSGRTI